MKSNLSGSFKKFILIVMALITLIVLSSCAASSVKMSPLDKSYDKLANKAAKELLQSEALAAVWTTVETGKPIYMYTAKNAVGDMSQVHYLAEFDAADKPEDEWIELVITISEASKTIVDSSVNYWNAEQYKTAFDENDQYAGDFICSWSSDAWFNVNLTNEEYEAAKEEFDVFDSANNNILSGVDYMIDMLGEPCKQENMDSTTDSYLPAEEFIFYIDSKNYRGNLFYGSIEEESSISSVYWRSDDVKINHFQDISSELAVKLGQEPVEYTPFSHVYTYRDKEILVQEFENYTQISIVK